MAAADTAAVEDLSVSTRKTGPAGCPSHRLVAVVSRRVAPVLKGLGGWGLSNL